MKADNIFGHHRIILHCTNNHTNIRVIPANCESGYESDEIPKMRNDNAKSWWKLVCQLQLCEK